MVSVDKEEAVYLAQHLRIAKGLNQQELDDLQAALLDFASHTHVLGDPRGPSDAGPARKKMEPHGEVQAARPELGAAIDPSDDARDTLPPPILKGC